MIVRALAGPGQPVTDLKAEELSIKTDGKDRKVQGLELVKIAAGGPRPAATAAPAAAPAKPASNLPAPFCDQLGTRAHAPCRPEAANF